MSEMTQGPDCLEEATTASTRVRRSGTARKRQIILATLRLVGEHGLAGTSLSRIAEVVGVSMPALYRHFNSREDLLLAVHQQLAERNSAWMNASQAPNVIDRIREIGQAHTRLVSEDIEYFTAPMLAFGSWLPSDSVRKEVERSRGEARQWFIDLVEEGKAQGSVRADIDTDLVVAKFSAWLWWEDLSYLQNVGSIETALETSKAMLTGFLDSIRVPSSALTEATTRRPPMIDNLGLGT